MKVDIYTQKAKKNGEYDLPFDSKELEVNEKVLTQYVYTYLSNQREGNANVKDRSEVSGGGKKPWKQKGTGRARVGSNRSPIWRGGGISFGPTNDVNWKLKLNKSFKKASFRNALVKIVRDDNLRVVDTLGLKEDKGITKKAVELKDSFKSKRILLVTKDRENNLINAFRNLDKSKVEMVSNISAYDLLNADKVLFEKEALDLFITKLGLN